MSVYWKCKRPKKNTLASPDAKPNQLLTVISVWFCSSKVKKICAPGWEEQTQSAKRTGRQIGQRLCPHKLRNMQSQTRYKDNGFLRTRCFTGFANWDLLSPRSWWNLPKSGTPVLESNCSPVSSEVCDIRIFLFCACFFFSLKLAIWFLPPGQCTCIEELSICRILELLALCHYWLGPVEMFFV